MNLGNDCPIDAGKISNIFFKLYYKNLCIHIGDKKGYILIRTKQIVWLDKNSTIELSNLQKPKWIFGTKVRPTRTKVFIEIVNEVSEETIKENPVIFNWLKTQGFGEDLSS